MVLVTDCIDHLESMDQMHSLYAGDSDMGDQVLLGVIGRCPTFPRFGEFSGILNKRQFTDDIGYLPRKIEQGPINVNMISSMRKFDLLLIPMMYKGLGMEYEYFSSLIDLSLLNRDRLSDHGCLDV